MKLRRLCLLLCGTLGKLHGAGQIDWPPGSWYANTRGALVAPGGAPILVAVTDLVRLRESA